MKHIKSFETLNKNIINKDNVNPNKIYILNIDKYTDIIGKIQVDNINTKNIPLITGFILQYNRPTTKFITDNQWNKIRLAKPKEIENYKTVKDNYDITSKKHIRNYKQTNDKTKKNSKYLTSVLFNFLKKLPNNVLPNNYIVTNNASTINITKRIKFLNVTGSLQINKNKINLKKQYGIIKYDYEFIIYFSCNNSDPYVKNIISYIINNISNNNTLFNKINKNNTNEERYTLTFNENNFDQIIDNINNLSIEDIKIISNENKFNL